MADDDDFDQDEEVAARDEEPSRDEEEDLAQPPRPRARLSWLTIALIFLNWIAAGAFVYLLFLDYSVRQEWTYAVFRNYLAIWGLPLAEEEQQPAYHEAKRRLRFDPDQLKDAFATPGRGGKGGGAFAPVDEPERFRILVSHMTDQVKKDYFQNQPQVATLNDEMARLKGKVPADIKKAADEVVAKYIKEDEKRGAVAQALLPLCWDIHAIERLDERIKEAKGADLDALLLDALQRRVYVDILAPVNIFRPGDTEKFLVEKAADNEAYPLEQLKALLEKRFDAAVAEKVDTEVQYGKVWDESKEKDGDLRDSLEKRQQVGFLMFALSQARVPLSNTRLYPDGLERAQLVSGIYEMAVAANNYARSLHVLEERVLQAIQNDRMGYLAPKGGRSSGFPEQYGTEVTRLKEAAANVYHAQGRLDHLKAQHAKLEQVYKDRLDHQKKIADRINQARKDTAEMLREVRELQAQLFQAQRTLADAAERNFALEAQIRQWEARVKAGR